MRLLPQKCGIYVWDMKFSSFEASGQGHSDLKQYATFQYPNMYPQYGISMSYSIEICSAQDLKGKSQKSRSQ